MKWIRLSFIVGLVTLLNGCLDSQPSNTAVEVMAKRYWHDSLQMQALFPIEQAQFISAYKEGSDVYVAQVRYRTRTQLSEADLFEALKRADQQGQQNLTAQPAVIKVLTELPSGFRAQDSIEFTKQFVFRDGSRGWLLERELME